MLKYKVVSRKNPVNKEVKYYAQLVAVNPVNLQMLTETISKQCTVTEHDVKAVISALQEQIAMNLRNGNSVRLGDLGSFRPIIKSKGSEDESKVSAANITGVKVCFSMSSSMRYMLSKTNPGVTFQLQATDEQESETETETVAA